MKTNQKLIDIFFGQIFHKRTYGNVHFFKNTSLFLLIELIEFSKIKSKSRHGLPFFFAYNKFNVLSWYAEDHGNRQKKSDTNDLIKFLRKLNNKSFDKIFLFCLPRVFGLGFNPLSIYFCYKNNKLLQTVFEVKNTFGDIHHYVLKQLDFKGNLQKANKLLFVSPFFPNKGYYHLDSKILKNKIKIDIKYFIKNSLHLHANVRAQKIKFSSLEIFKNLIKFIIFPGKIWINIHIEAIKLWIKKNKLISIPKEQTKKHSYATKITNNKF